MTAMRNDDLSIMEIKHLITDTAKRMSVLGITRDTILNPKSYRERILTDAIYMNVFRILEEANGLDFETKTEYMDFPWTEIRGMRNRFAHDYSHLDAAAVWEAIENGFPELERLTDDYIERHGLSTEEREVPSCLDQLERDCGSECDQADGKHPRTDNGVR